MTKIGNTKSWVIRCLHQYFTFVARGGEVVMSNPHPDAPGDLSASAATFSVVSDHGDAEIDPVVKEALLAASSLTWAIASGEVTAVEEMPSQDGETKYTITIKKQQ